MRRPYAVLAAVSIFCANAGNAAVTIAEVTQVNLLRGSTTVATLQGWDACIAEARRLANADTRTTGTVTYTCQTERRRVTAAYSADPQPDPPADSDGDGVPDSSDQCPTQPGAGANGCPALPPPDPPADGRQGKNPVNPVSARLTGLRTFDIGPGQRYTFDSVPWGTLTAGDVINIHYQAEPYVAKFGVRARGSATFPVIINGVTDASGNRPVITGAGARTAAGSREVFTTTPQYGESLGIAVIKRGPADDYLDPKPSHIHIQNLELRDARGGYTTLAGGTAQYDSAACIYVHVGADILIANVIATNCAFGIFTMQKDDILLQAAERVTVRNSRIYGNGKSGSWFEHNLYMQGDSTIVEGCYIGKVMAGSVGSSFKDRSARLIFRWNYVESSARLLDFVHAEEQAQGVAALPHYGVDYVYGNTLVNDSAESSIHYGNDNWCEQETGSSVCVPPVVPRKHLYFWGNTVTHTLAGWRNHAFDLSLVGTTADVWGNTFAFGTQTETHYWLEYAGDLRLGANTVNGSVQLSGRDGSNADMYRITTGAPVPANEFLNSLL